MATNILIHVLIYLIYSFNLFLNGVKVGFYCIKWKLMFPTLPSLLIEAEVETRSFLRDPRGSVTLER